MIDKYRYVLILEQTQDLAFDFFFITNFRRISDLGGFWLVDR